MHAFTLWPYIVQQPARFRKSDPIRGKRTANTSGHKSVMEGPTMVLIVSIALLYTYTMAKHQYLRKRGMHAFALWPYIVKEPVRFRKSDPIRGKRTTNKRTQQCDGGP